ncbi:unnamed protein product [Arctia plantaginis]|uniref:Uncharacterized protein n=1 Tax=Arctia plantaginis TaxID=874455 RepID=A0A8S0YXQ9_ARCPL|nr:unnamed protein product [Arctia plantaginis]
MKVAWLYADVLRWNDISDVGQRHGHYEYEFYSNNDELHSPTYTNASNDIWNFYERSILIWNKRDEKEKKHHESKLQEAKETKMRDGSLGLEL